MEVFAADWFLSSQSDKLLCPSRKLFIISGTMASTDSQPMIPEALSLKRLYIFTYPRTASSLLVKILNLPNQPSVISRKGGGYFFLPAIQRQRELRLLEKSYPHWSEDEKERLREQFQQCSRDFGQFFASEEAAGKTIVVKEHVTHMIDPISKMSYVYSSQYAPEPPWKINLSATNTKRPRNMGANNTVLQDEFLRTWFPTFLIRHPAVAFPSYYRIFFRSHPSEEEMSEIEGELTSAMTLRWTRHLYDWYINLWEYLTLNNTKRAKPIVLDAEDMLSDPQILIRFCDVVGLDSKKLRFNWDPPNSTELQQTDPLTKKMNATLLSSSGVIKGKKADDLNLEYEIENWKAEFGEYGGLRLAKWVQTAMPDYEYLRSKAFI